MSVGLGRLAGKRTLITGAGSGLGRAMSLRFGKEGALVACCDIDGDSARQTERILAAESVDAVAVQADVRSEEGTDAMVGAVLSAFKGLDVLVANAGVDGVGSAADVTADAWDQVIAVNLTGVWLSCRAGLRQMLTQGTGGSIVCTASVAGLIGSAATAANSASKGGVIALARQMALDYGPAGIRVNALCPATVPTPLVHRIYAMGGSAAAGRTTSIEDTLAATAPDRFPLGRVGRDEDIANAALYLASDEADWVTGTAFVVDGGLTAH